MDFNDTPFLINLMIRYIFFLLFLLFPTAACLADENIVVEQWRNMPLDELMQRGRDYANDENSKDSALACFLMACVRYDEEMNLEDKDLCARAFNNCGMLYTLKYYDFAKAYSYLSRALRICDECKLEATLPIVYLNMGNLFSIYNRFMNSSSASSRSVELYKKCFDVSRKCGDWEGLVSAAINLYNTQSLSFDSAFLFSDSIPSDTPDLEYVRSLYRARSLSEQGKYREARQVLFADGEREEHHFNSMRHKTTRGSFIADYYEDEGLLDSCIYILQSMLAFAESMNQRDAVILMSHKLARVYALSGDSLRSNQYYYQYYHKKDEFSQETGLGSIIETDLLNQIENEQVYIQRMALEKERQQQWILVLLLVMLIILVAAIVVIYKNRQLYARNLALYQKTQELMQVEQNERELRRTMPAAEVVDNLTARIQLMMDNPEVFCQQDFTLARLAQLVESNTSYVSKVINQTYGKSFSVLLGDCRVKEACLRLADQEHYGNLTIEAISESVGFKSRTTFLSAFKRSIGLSPSEYQKLALEHTGEA